MELGQAPDLRGKMAEARIVEKLGAEGYSHSFLYDDDSLRCVETGEVFREGDVTLIHAYRFEGNSDPDDMSVVYAVETDNGMKGTLIDAFGVYAIAELGEFINRLKNRRGEDVSNLPQEGTKNPASKVVGS